MLLDIPNEIPRRRAPEVAPSAPALEPSPIELRREALAARALDRKPMPQAPQNRSREHEPPHRSERDVNVPMDQRPRRQTIPPQAIGLSLRDEERKVLVEACKYRSSTGAGLRLAATAAQGRTTMSKLKIEKGASKVRRAPLKVTINGTVSDDLELMCHWSENDSSYLVNLLLGFAIAQSEEFQKYKADHLATSLSSRADAKSELDAPRKVVPSASGAAPQLEKGVTA